MASATPSPVCKDGQSRGLRTVVLPVLAQRYELGPVLGEGGSAQVHWAWDQKLNRAVAVKLFAPGVAGADRHRQDRELAALTRLTHPGLVELYDTGTDHGRAYLVMRLAQGPSLADRLHEATLGVSTVAQLGAQLANALTYVHAQGVTHRDIKPANVLFDEHNHPLLTDFGIALLVDTTRITLTGAVIGTAAYMAPEQVRGELVGPPADVYSLGLVLLEALTSRREYPGTSVESACARLHRPAEVPVNLPGELTDTLRRMTAIEPTERPSSAAAAHALHAAATEFHSGTTVEYTTTLTELLDQPAQTDGITRRRRHVMFAGVASSVALTAGLLGLTALNPTHRTTGVPSPPSPTAAASLPAPPTGPAAPPTAPSISPVPAQPAGNPPAPKAPAPTSPAVAPEKPVPPPPLATPTQVIPPPATDPQSARSRTPQSDIQSSHGSNIFDGSGNSSSDVTVPPLTAATDDKRPITSARSWIIEFPRSQKR
ncbi:MAG TPA: serine/threonine-protein kinase [Pseudonocardiaceae bacterium]